MSIFPLKTDLPPEHCFDRPLDQKEYLIGGELLKWSGRMHEVLSPVCVMEDGEIRRVVLGSYPMLDAVEAKKALDAAVKAYDSGKGQWPTMNAEERLKYFEKFVIKMKEKRDEVVKLLMWEIGKSLPDSQKEFDRTIAYIIDTIEAAKELDRVSSRFQIEDGIIAQIRRAPLGVVLCMGPFNYPLNETFTTLIPALITGNTVIFKPPKFGVLLHQPLLEIFRTVFPAGVVNTVYGDGAETIGSVMQSGLLNAFAFIGTSKVADILKKQHPHPHRMKSILGLEAKNPAIILADANLKNAVDECVLGSLSYNGQRCTALKIIFVHRSIAAEFVKMLADSVDRLKCGMPWENGVNITPLPETGKSGYLKDLVDDAVSKGAKIVNKTGALVEETFFHPAVLYPVNSTMKVFHEEQFGPVVPVIPFDDVNEPVDYIISSNYGQQAAVFGTDPEVIAEIIDPLSNQVCRININCQCQRGPDVYPFTGRKDSAEGTLSVTDALRVFTIRTLVAGKSTGLNKEIFNDIVRERRSNFLSTDFIF
ncbi:MAG TPA: NADP-dependent glyceraldehyde-3-phosphate dehydrogenase [bacterium]|nr:NADP-dependent glyceraldehyde-3-phosphate dehydrogenase [bacterium]